MKKIITIYTRTEWLIILVVALGYFVDAYDLLVFSAVRKPSLLALGVPETRIMDVGLNLLNWQLVGLVFGGIFWGMLADKFGRRTILFFSIITYSVVNLLNATINSVDQYILLRFIGGIGLAGELGVGISLITENIPANKRTIATTIISVFGMLGAGFGGVASLFLSWKMCYVVGGLAGIGLLLLRLSVKESAMFKKIKEQNLKRGNLLLILFNPRLLMTYLFCTMAGSITFVTIGLFIQNTPEFGKLFNVNPIPKGSWAIIFFYLGAAPSEILAGIISRKLKSRKIPMYIFLSITMISILIFCIWQPHTISGFYFTCFLLGLGLGYWTILISTSAEQFGVNIRATAATSIPNVARAWSIPFVLLFTNVLKPNFGLIDAALLTAVFAIILSIISVKMLKETFENNAEFID